MKLAPTALGQQPLKGRVPTGLVPVESTGRVITGCELQGWATPVDMSIAISESVLYVSVRGRIKAFCRKCLCIIVSLCLLYVYVGEVLTVYHPSKQLRSISDTRTFHIPFTKTKTFRQRAFSFTGPTQWNSLPYDVRHSASTASFKQALKIHLFRSAYN